MNPTHSEWLSIPSNPFQTTILIRINPKSNPDTCFIREPNPNESETNPNLPYNSFKSVSNNNFNLNQSEI